MVMTAMEVLCLYSAFLFKVGIQKAKSKDHVSLILRSFSLLRYILVASFCILSVTYATSHFITNHFWYYSGCPLPMEKLEMVGKLENERLLSEFGWKSRKTIRFSPALA